MTCNNAGKPTTGSRAVGELNGNRSRCAFDAVGYPTLGRLADRAKNANPQGDERRSPWPTGLAADRECFIFHLVRSEASIRRLKARKLGHPIYYGNYANSNKCQSVSLIGSQEAPRCSSLPALWTSVGEVLCPACSSTPSVSLSFKRYYIFIMSHRTAGMMRYPAEIKTSRLRMRRKEQQRFWIWPFEPFS